MIACVGSADRVSLPSDVGARLADLIPQHVGNAKPAGELDYVNLRVCEYFGLDARTFMGQGWLEVVHPDDIDASLAAWTSSLSSGEPYEVEFRLRRHDGVYRRHIARAVALRERGAIVKWYGTSTDIEDERRAEAERDRLRDEIAKTEALRRSDAMKTALLRAVSHDLRSPLTAIVTAAEASLAPERTEADRLELTAVVLEEALRLERLVSKLLDLARLRGGAAVPRLDWCSVDELLEGALGDLPADGEGIAFDVPAGLPLVRVDAVQVERALANIVENARRYRRAAPVRIAAEARDGLVLVRVTDDGPGIPADERERVFEPFVRLDDGHPAGGSGLGLAIARGFVQASGGTVCVEPVDTPGATILLELPAGSP
jgi:PAS domain S-box-containing protein